MRLLSTLTVMALCAGCAAEGDLALSTGLVDFGPALPGAERLERVELINKGEATLTISGFESTNPTFSVVLPARLELDAHESRAILVRHVPPIGATEPEVADLEVWSEDGIVAALHASSLPTTPDCAVPEMLDFGPIPLGESKTLELPLRNGSPRASGAFVELYTTHEAFETSLGWQPLEAWQMTTIPVTFAPRSERTYRASIYVKQHPLCQAQPVRLLGEGSGAALTFAPAIMNWVLPFGRTEVQAVTLRNFTFIPVQLLSVAASSPFDITRFPVRLPPAERAGTGAVLPGEATVEIAFTGQGEELRAGQLVIATDLATMPTIQINLRGFTAP